MNVSANTVNFVSAPWIWLQASLYLRPYSTVPLLCIVPWLSYIALGRITTSRRIRATDGLNGPANPSFFFGFYRLINEADDPGVLFDHWALQYGPAFRIPGGFGSNRIVICDPKAAAHFYSKQVSCYVRTKLSQVLIENLFGRGLLWAEGQNHHTQRKALSPAFSNAAIRKLTPVFYDATYKMKVIWDSILEAGSGEAIIDVQLVQFLPSVDAVGAALFGHDFQALDGQENIVADLFDSFASRDASLISRIVFLMGAVFPILQKLPTKKNRIVKHLKDTMQGVAEELLAGNSEGGVDREKGMGEEKSIMGLLGKRMLMRS
ncbi:hypothetical protein HYPSUDRAFT_143511 [Hypholoma sublateritium FD-334 SS-4]|uniref:Cytochrome P450 n=1 Tax=Hypholoma sublateritium (strain FD-334 SS-4) TaxID=945553 RepID=A0A0D2M8C8_HYPSF|nr:hypothetical protein HYPSUDRAFT_143511 [Hypholoma sublateritium FD-334 SS-4]